MMPSSQRSEHTHKKRARAIARNTGMGYQRILELLRKEDSWRDRLATPRPSRRDVELAGRVAVARAFGGGVEGQCVVGATVGGRRGLKIAVVVRHQRGRGEGARPDGIRGPLDPSWDAVAFIQFAQDGSLTVAQLLYSEEVAAYRAEGRRDRMAYNETSFRRPDGTWYGTDVRRAVRPILDWPAALPMP